MTDPVARIEAELARRVAAHEPPDDWEQRVLAATVGTRRVEAELGRRVAAHEPPADWEARVLAATVGTRQQSSTPIRPRARRVWLVLPALAAAAIVVLVLVRRSSDQPALVVETERGGQVRSGDPATATVGDTLRAAFAKRAPHRALWVYRDAGELLIACPGAAGCGDRDGAMILALELRVAGTYHVVAVTSDASIPAPHGQLNTDLGAAERAGAERDVRTVDVR